MEHDVFDVSLEDRTAPQTKDQIHLKELILLFESLPEIWDASNEHFTNKVKKAQAYRKLLVIFKKIKPYATIDDVRKKINSLRSNYRKELRKAVDSQRSGVGKEHVYKPRSWVFHMLNFLSKTDRVSYQNQLSGSEDVQDGEEEENSQPSSSVFFSSLNIAPSPSKKERKESTTDHYDHLEEACSLTSQPERSKEQNLNLTALYWTQKLEQLDPLQRIFAEKAINDILFEAELGTLKRNSVQINVTSVLISSPSSNMNSATLSPSHKNSLTLRSGVCKYTPVRSPPSVTTPSSVHYFP